MENEIMIKKLVAAGARRWRKGDMDRLYISYDVLGYGYEKFNTDDVCSARLNGERISISEMYRVLAAKTYVDTKTMKVHSNYSGVDYTKAVEQFIEQAYSC